MRSSYSAKRKCVHTASDYSQMAFVGRSPVAILGLVLHYTRVLYCTVSFLPTVYSEVRRCLGHCVPRYGTLRQPTWRTHPQPSCSVDIPIMSVRMVRSLALRARPAATDSRDIESNAACAARVRARAARIIYIRAGVRTRTRRAPGAVLLDEHASEARGSEAAVEHKNSLRLVLQVCRLQESRCKFVR